jgi:type IV secretory pathway VirB4 component
MAKESQPTQKFVEIEEIKDGVVILKSGSLRSVLMVSGINFELKSEEEQNMITYAYQNFLNTLDFSVQFVIHSRKLNIEGYLGKLEERQGQEANELLKNQISEYTEFIRSFVELNAVMAKTFFVIVPYDPIVIPGGGKKLLNFLKTGIPGVKTKATAKKESLAEEMAQLNQRVEQVTNGLGQIGLRVVALNNEELTELFYNLYNPESAEKKELKIAEEQTAAS